MGDVVLAATDRPLQLAVRRLDDERVPEGMIGLGSYLNERLIARCAVNEDTATFMEEQHLFERPVHLVLAAAEQSPGLQCRLFAVVDVDPRSMGADDDEDGPEPWADSVPGAGFEAAIAEGNESGGIDGDAKGMVFLGHIVRLDRDRKHPDSLALEAADVLRRLVEGKTSEVVDRLLDDLLGEGNESA
jgi:hypothetical protein